MALALPRFVVFQSTVRQKNYLRYIHEDGGLHGLLQFSGEEIVSPYSKFEIVRANSPTAAGNDNGFVHIRCCYNNKYLVANSISSDSFIIAGADEPNEDQSQWSCTLFEPIPVSGEGGSSSSSTNATVRFRHVQLGRYLTGACLFAQSSSTDSDRLDVFGIIDLGSLLILPKHIALKGDNGLYLSARHLKDGYKYLEFTSSDNGDPTVGNEVFITKDGRVRIKNNHSSKFWMRSPDWNWIWAYSDDTTTDNLDTLFSPVKVGDNVIALRNLGNNNFCMRMTSREGKESCLHAGVDTLSKEARLVVEELVISREIYNVNTTVHVRFRHVKLGHYLRSLMTRDNYHACVSTSYDRRYYIDDHMHHVVSLMFMSLVSRVRDHYHACPYVRPTAPARLDVFRIIDWESLLILPKHIALKGDNGLYLSARRIERHQYLQFTSSDIGDPTVGNEVFITKGGSVRIKNNHFGKFWRHSPNGIRADSDDTTTNNLDTLFYPVKVGDNVIALCNLGNNNFCNSHRNYLKAAVTTISREARLVVEELVISRKIYNVKFRLLDARIYNQNIITMVTKTATNNTQVSNTTTLKLLRKETRSTTWNGSISLKLGMKTNIQTGIPLIVEGKVELFTEFTGDYQWGETMSTENQVETEYTIKVPPMSKVTLSLLATMGSCDVPFSYTQRDMLMNGKQVIYNLDDGIYTGINSFNFVYETKQEKL